MYNGIGLVTPRGSGTNGFVTRNLSAVRQTKEKVPDYQPKDDAAVRPFDPELVEHDRRRQAEVRCMELRDLLEEQELPEAEIDEKVNAFRAKLLAEKNKKLSYQVDSSGRRLVKDSHEYSVAQEQKNDRAKDAFGIREDFVPGSSLEGRQGKDEMSAEAKEAVEVADSVSKIASPPVPSRSGEKEKAKKRKKSHKRSKRSSSSSSSSSSDEESHRKKRKKEKKKKSKKSHRHRRSAESNPKSRERSSNLEGCDSVVDELPIKTCNGPPSPTPPTPPGILFPDNIPTEEEPAKISIANHTDEESESDVDDDTINAKYSLSIVDFSGHHTFYPSLPNSKLKDCEGNSATDVLRRACLPLLANVSKSAKSPVIDTNGNHERYTGGCSHHGSRSRSSSSDSKYSNNSNRSRSHSQSNKRQRQHSISLSRTPSRSPVSVRSHGSLTSRSSSRSSYKSRSPCRSHHSRNSRSRSKSKSRSRSRSTSRSDSSRSPSSASSKSKSRSRSRSESSRSGSGSPVSDKSRSPKSNKSRSPKANRSRSPSIPRRRGSPSFMERRRITSARKRPIPYKRKDAVEWNVSSDSDSED